MPNTAATLLDAAVKNINDAPEVSATWMSENLGSIRLIDVREPHELSGPLGQVADVENTPLVSFLGQIGRMDPEQPVVLICRSGRRSGLAARELAMNGFEHVASVEGGMMAWQLEVEHKHDIASEEKVANTHNLNEAVGRRNGVPEVPARWVHSNLGRFKLIDVREPAELRSMGAVPQAENHPLQRFMQTAGTMERDTPVVVMCASGGRSARAVNAMLGAGFTTVASMEGGIFGWRAAGLPTV